MYRWFALLVSKDLRPILLATCVILKMFYTLSLDIIVYTFVVFIKVFIRNVHLFSSAIVNVLDCY